jgi:hypothetical protein
VTAIPFNPGSAWVEPKLYRFDGIPEAWEITVLRPWPDPRAWRLSSESSRWVGCRPHLDLAIPDRPLRKNASRRRRLEHEALQRVPEGLRRLVGPHHDELQWGLLSMAARVDGAPELLEGNPALAVALAHSFRLRKPVKQPLRSARWLVRRPRRRIAGWLGFPERESTVRALARMEPEDCSLYVLRQLGQLLASGERWVHHIPKLRAEVVLLMEPMTRPALSFGLLEEIALEKKASRRSNTAFEIRLVLTVAAALKPERKLPKLRSVAQVRQLLDELIEEERQQRLLRWKAAGPFPEPPYGQGELPIVLREDRPVQVAPIADAEALLDHAAHQHNCLANDEEYLEKIIDGTGYLYELRWEPGEDEEPAGSATLFIEGKGVLHRYWGVDDMRLRFNGEPPVWLDAQVARFLARAPASREPEAGQVATEDLLDERQLSLPFGWEWVERLGEEDGLPF